MMKVNLKGIPQSTHKPQLSGQMISILLVHIILIIAMQICTHSTSFMKGITTIKLRPHYGKASDIDHLATEFLFSHNIAHGNNLRKPPTLQYLFYLS